MLKILIPTDLSENALKATHYATELFKHGPAHIFLLHAYADEVYDLVNQKQDSEFETVKREIFIQTDAALKMLQKEIFVLSPNPKHTVECCPEFSSLVDAVNDWVERENIDLVIMGTKGKTADKKLTFGSNTLQVIKYVKCPVLAVPESQDLDYPENIVFATDFQLPYKRRELKLLSNIGKRFGARIHFLYVSKHKNLSLRQKDNKVFIEAVLRENHTYFHHIEEDDITQGINTFIEKNNPDMLVMVNRRHSYLENILYQSTIEKIGLNIKIPFLVLQNLPR